MIRNCENLDTFIPSAVRSEWNIGVDMVEIARFQQLKYQSNKQFYTRVFTPNEIKYCLSFSCPEPHFATNFAGKEAVYKAVNMFCDVKLNSIEILRDEMDHQSSTCI
jgi:holo-[acyl-carrier protein] synthase